MSIQRDVSLKPYNTFGIEATARYFAEIHSTTELQEVLESWEGPTPFVLGGGSNLLLTGTVDTLVLLNRITGKDVISERKGQAIVRSGAGEEWHEFVRWCIRHGLGGIENLSLIPGTVGAAPIQNIGAYGVELSDVFRRLEAVELQTGKLHEFRSADCRFGYRDSVFKSAFKGKYCITAVELKLTTEAHRLNTSYGAIQQTLEAHHIAAPTIENLSDAVIAIRQSKLPDPKEIGNSGSFFKNPVVSRTKYEQLQAAYPEIPGYPQGADEVKVPAGWLIDRAGWKGKRVGNTGSYEKQALVLVNHGGATGREIWALAEQIMADVERRYGIRLEPEVNVL